MMVSVYINEDDNYNVIGHDHQNDDDDDDDVHINDDKRMCK